MPEQSVLPRPSPDFDLLIDDDLDRRQSDQLREAGTMSEMLAAVYLDTLAPITESLTLAD